MWEFIGTYPLGDEIMLWDEFAPDLYELTAQLESNKGLGTWTGSFGMRDIRSGASVEEVRALFKTKAESIKSRATAKADHFEKGFEA